MDKKCYAARIVKYDFDTESIKESKGYFTTQFFNSDNDAFSEIKHYGNKKGVTGNKQGWFIEVSRMENGDLSFIGTIDKEGKEHLGVLSFDATTEPSLLSTDAINKYSALVYESNKEKGFWDKERIYEEILALVCSELSESLEGHRKNKSANLVAFRENMSEGANFTDSFLKHIKDSYQDELADAVIRVMDLCGAYCIASLPISGEISKDNGNFGSFIFRLTKICVNMGNYGLKSSNLPIVTSRFIAVIKAYCAKNDIDLDAHISLKLMYNKTRDRLHGKSY